MYTYIIIDLCMFLYEHIHHDSYPSNENRWLGNSRITGISLEKPPTMMMVPICFLLYLFMDTLIPGWSTGWWKVSCSAEGILSRARCFGWWFAVHHWMDHDGHHDPYQAPDIGPVYLHNRVYWIGPIMLGSIVANHLVYLAMQYSWHLYLGL